MTLRADKFIRRFLLHVLPRGVHAHSVLRGAGQSLSHSTVSGLRRLLAQPAPPVLPRESAATMMQRLRGIDIARCPQCHQGRLVGIATLYPLHAPGQERETTHPP